MVGQCRGYSEIFCDPDLAKQKVSDRDSRHRYSDELMKFFARIRAERTTHCWKINFQSFFAVLARIQGNFLLLFSWKNIEKIFSILSQNVRKYDLTVQRKWRNSARARTRECRNLCSGSAQPRGPPQHHPVWAGNWPENPGVFCPVLPGWKENAKTVVSEHEMYIKRFQILMWNTWSAWRTPSFFCKCTEYWKFWIPQNKILTSGSRKL